MALALVSSQETRLDAIARKIRQGHERTHNGDQEWIEGSLELAQALREGRDSMPENIAFKDWLAKEGLDFLGAHDRAALINMASDLALTRSIFTETESRSYRLIWQENKKRFDTDVKTHHRKRKSANISRMGLRTMKLGEKTMEMIKGTSLATAAEMGELVRLNRGSPLGEVNEIVRSLVERAHAGEMVSAVAMAAKMGAAYRPKTLKECWHKRMAAPWLLAGREERQEFIQFLTTEMNRG